MIAVTLSNNGVEIKELPIPEIKSDQVLVKVYFFLHRDSFIYLASAFFK